MISTEKQRAFIIKFTYFILIAALIFASFKFILPLFMPFVIGFFIAFILRPAINFLTDKIKINPALTSTVVLLLFYAITIAALTSFGAKLFSKISEMVLTLPDVYKYSIETNLETFFSKVESLAPNVDLFGWDNLSQSIMSLVASFSSNALNFVTSAATRAPAFMIKLIITIIASFFFTFDYKKIINFVLNQFSEKNREFILNVKKSSIVAVFKLIKAYAILLSVTFIELWIGLTILKVDAAFPIAILIAMVDILPILGTGSIIIPWAIISLINGNSSMAIGLFIIYIVITVVRQVLEPKVVGSQIGLYPLITLMCMFIGAQLFGIVGLFGFPIAATIIKNLHDTGAIKFIK